MNPRTGIVSHSAGILAGPKHSQAMIKNEAPMPSRVLSMRALIASKRATRALRSARRAEYCSVGDTKKSVAHYLAALALTRDLRHVHYHFTCRSTDCQSASSSPAKQLILLSWDREPPAGSSPVSYRKRVLALSFWSRDRA